MDGQNKNDEAANQTAAAVRAEPGTVTDPTLTAKLIANYKALQNDVQQARELAADFQSQLAGKSNEFADLKRVFSETKNHLIRLEANIAELREERHRLAGEAMRAVALERKLVERDETIAAYQATMQKLREERHRLAAEAVRATALDRKLADRDAEITQLNADITALQERLARTRTPAATRARQNQPSGWRGWFRSES